MSSLALVDVDGDGQRDLILGHYERGSGAFDQDDGSTASFVDVLLRRGRAIGVSRIAVHRIQPPSTTTTWMASGATAIHATRTG